MIFVFSYNVSDRMDAWDLVTIGDHTSLCIDCQLQPIRILKGYLVVGAIEIGERCYIGAKSVIVGGLERPTVVQDEAQVFMVFSFVLS